ncbi:hypothetical protein A0U93_05700 [Neoasaia chiangmaiensis]|uniref:Periplasmic heavy metal sensor n=2 Tax=Neoasaia chiangmaiensis TaxID=320497 RepID=A0A1U9KNZ6_9PROT|nr:hypothetical protein A0U93_05700 [Neoasaia chiangmaiensis]
MLAAAPAFLAAAHGQDVAPPPHEMHGPHGRMMMPMLAGIDLTKQQREKLHALWKSHHGDMRASWHRERDLDDQIAAVLMADGTVDRARLTALFQQKDALRAQAEQASIDDAIQVHDILTPQQLAQARATHAKLEGLEQQIHDLLKPPHDDVDAPQPD